MGFSQARPGHKKVSRKRRGNRGGRKHRVQTPQNVVGRGIFNLSTKTLTDSEKSLLDKGLKFAPPQSLNRFGTYMDIHKFVRKIHIKRYMAGITPSHRLLTNGFVHSGLSNSSLFNPPGGMAPSLKTFRDVLLRDLEGMEIKKAKLSKNLQEGLDSLCKNKDLVIRPADKGGVSLSWTRWTI